MSLFDDVKGLGWLSPRLMVTGGSALVLAGLNVYLLSGEEILTLVEEAGQTVREEDPLLGLRYTPGERRGNLTSYGLDEGLVDQVMQELDRLEKDKVDKKLEKAFAEAGDPQAVADALCGDGANLRPRYSAMEFFVQEDGGKRTVINMRRGGALERQDWAIDGPIAEVYRVVELSDSRESDATLMGVAALLLSQEQQVFDYQAPWGRGLLSQWSWDEVLERYPQVQDQVIKYFAVMHLATETAQKDEGICD